MVKRAKTGGRKSGTPNKATSSIKEVAQRYSIDAIETILSIMQDAQAPVSARLQAASLLLDRAYGKPAPTIEPTTDAGEPPALNIVFNVDAPVDEVIVTNYDPSNKWKVR